MKDYGKKWGWLGVATWKEMTDNIKNMCKLPKHILPYVMISSGYPGGQSNEFVDRY
ncbi:hypothetical protein [Candidatus Galacturonibacter soehngenii]|uniref:hypothetical protein n=1 Tax=Candidatus Galacturonatibacter soehngenii TaxID=2307010 RepID=UPI001787104B|nr:hypothetical protein [Candidatus Galacturonibacter soehngenii]